MTVKLIFLLVLLSFLAIGFAESATEPVEPLTNAEEVILSTIVANATSDGSREDNALEAHLFQEALRSAYEVDETDDFSNQNSELEKNLHQPTSVAVAKSEDDMTAWELVKAQIAADFAPFLLLIPAPVKTAVAQWMKRAKVSALNVAFGALQPTLLVTSKLFHDIGDKITHLAKYLESNRARQFVPSPRSSPANQATNKLPSNAEPNGKQQKYGRLGNREIIEVGQDTEVGMIKSIENGDVEVIEL